MPEKFLPMLIWTLALLLPACQEQPGTAGKNATPKDDVLVLAHACYQLRNFKQGAARFSACLTAKTGNLQARSRQQEAILGLALCRLLTGADQWQTPLNKWPGSGHGYWQGQTFTVLEGLAPTIRRHFQRQLPTKGQEGGLWLLLRLALLDKHYRVAPQIIAAIGQEHLAWRYCLAFAWARLKNNRYLAPGALFDLLLRTPTSGKSCQQEAGYGLMLAVILETGRQRHPISLPTAWRYRLDLDVVDFFRTDSPMVEYRQRLLGLPAVELNRLVVADMLYALGAKSRNKIDVWQKGLHYLEATQPPPVLADVYSDYRTRFRLAIAWNHLLSGSRENARKIFTDCQQSGNSQSRWQEDARLGLALLAFKQEQELEAASALLVGCQIGRHYWLGGKKFDFYRLPERVHRRDAIEQLCRDRKQRCYLTMLDALCLLGDGRAAQTLLGNIVAASSDSSVRNIYLAESANIPADAYAENQIWEKPD